MAAVALLCLSSSFLLRRHPPTNPRASAYCTLAIDLEQSDLVVDAEGEEMAVVVQNVGMPLGEVELRLQHAGSTEPVARAVAVTD
eukprot:7387488-Prymnesium_polylepis.2